MALCSGAFVEMGGGGTANPRRQRMTCSWPCSLASDRLFRPVSAPACCSLSRASLTIGTQARPVPDSSRQDVRMARRRHEVRTRSYSVPSALSARAASRASWMPRVVRSTSTQPVKRFARFHSLCPWRTSTSLACGASSAAAIAAVSFRADAASRAAAASASAIWSSLSAAASSLSSTAPPGRRAAAARAPVLPPGRTGDDSAVVTVRRLSISTARGSCGRG
mmetsp:Transcript_33202/g.106549  ORF Transcript_33202/g.106549 Transcript_33202/m.106549 type:complete len:222 (-) Transcript_33202:30-695(-)